VGGTDPQAAKGFKAAQPPDPSLSLGMTKGGGFHPAGSASGGRVPSVAWDPVNLLHPSKKSFSRVRSILNRVVWEGPAGILVASSGKYWTEVEQRD
jgi:hypothetical protein